MREGERRERKSNVGKKRQIRRQGRENRGREKAKIFISFVTKGNLSFSTSSLTNTHKHEYKHTYGYPHCALH